MGVRLYIFFQNVLILISRPRHPIEGKVMVWGYVYTTKPSGKGSYYTARAVGPRMRFVLITLVPHFWWIMNVFFFIISQITKGGFVSYGPGDEWSTVRPVPDNVSKYIFSDYYKCPPDGCILPYRYIVWLISDRYLFVVYKFFFGEIRMEQIKKSLVYALLYFCTLLA